MPFLAQKIPLSATDYPLRGEGGGVPPFSVNFFPLTFWENLVHDGPGGEGEYPLMEIFRDWGYWTLPLHPNRRGSVLEGLLVFFR